MMNWNSPTTDSVSMIIATPTIVIPTIRTTTDLQSTVVTTTIMAPTITASVESLSIISTTTSTLPALSTPVKSSVPSTLSAYMSQERIPTSTASGKNESNSFPNFFCISNFKLADSFLLFPLFPFIILISSTSNKHSQSYLFRKLWNFSGLL